MDTLLVIGTDSVVGGNLAAALAERWAVVGVSASHRVAIEGCRPAPCDPGGPAAGGCSPDLFRWIRVEPPVWAIYCGPFARSSWDELAGEAMVPARMEAVRQLAAGLHEVGAAFTYISSDAIFSGPWLFHDETETPRPTNWPATVARLWEDTAAQACPKAMIVRTNAYGWDVPGGQRGFAQRVLAALEEGTPIALDGCRHATPIPASHLAEVLEAAYQRALSGTFHVGGAERTSPYRFGRALADAFGLDGSAVVPEPASRDLDAPEGAAGEACTAQYGAGETSLNSRRIRKLVGMPMPMLHEALARFRQERETKFAERFSGPAPQGHVA